MENNIKIFSLIPLVSKYLQWFNTNITNEKYFKESKYFDIQKDIFAKIINLGDMYSNSAKGDILEKFVISRFI